MSTDGENYTLTVTSGFLACMDLKTSTTHDEQKGVVKFKKLISLT